MLTLALWPSMSIGFLSISYLLDKNVYTLIWGVLNYFKNTFMKFQLKKYRAFFFQCTDVYQRGIKFHKRKNTINAQRLIKYNIQTMAQNAAVGNLVIKEDSKYWA